MTKIRTLLVPGFVLVAAILLLWLTDPANVGIRFLAKFAIFTVLVLTALSMTISRVFGSDTSRRVLGNLVLVGISAGIALLGAEVATRVAYLDVSTTSDNASYFASRWYKLHPPILNAMGFREVEVSKSKSPDIYRIAIIGDSLCGFSRRRA